MSERRGSFVSLPKKSQIPIQLSCSYCYDDDYYYYCCYLYFLILFDFFDEVDQSLCSFSRKHALRSAEHGFGSVMHSDCRDMAMVRDSL